MRGGEDLHSRFSGNEKAVQHYDAASVAPKGLVPGLDQGADAALYFGTHVHSEL